MLGAVRLCELDMDSCGANKLESNEGVELGVCGSGFRGIGAVST